MADTQEKKICPCCTKHTMRSEEERKKLINRLKRVEGQEKLLRIFFYSVFCRLRKIICSSERNFYGQAYPDAHHRAFS